MSEITYKGHHLENDTDVVSQWVPVPEGQLQRDSVGVEERAGLESTEEDD